jgi:hypothetical protein
MNRRRQIYEGKAKILYEGPEPGTLIQYFKDDATAFNAQKKGTINGKGVINNRISEHVFTLLANIGIPTHFIKRLNMREQLVRQVDIIPIEVVVRNVAAGSLSKRLGVEEGTQLSRTILEYYYKDDALGDPLITEEHIACFGWASPEELHDIADMAIRINDFMSGLFAGIGIGKMILRASSSPMKSARMAAAFGTWSRARSSTRIGSAAIWGGKSKPIKKWRAALACCPKVPTVPCLTLKPTEKSFGNYSKRLTINLNLMSQWY